MCITWNYHKYMYWERNQEGSLICSCINTLCCSVLIWMYVSNIPATCCILSLVSLKLTCVLLSTAVGYNEFSVMCTWVYSCGNFLLLPPPSLEHIVHKGIKETKLYNWCIIYSATLGPEWVQMSLSCGHSTSSSC